MNNVRTRILAAGLAGAVALGAATPVIAAPVMTSTAVLKSALPAPTQVRWRGGGPAIAGGIIAGLAVGAIAGAASAPYYGGDPYYDYGPAPGPAYYDYAPAPGAIYVQPGPVYPRPYYYGGYRNWHDPAGCGPGTHVC